MDQGWIAPWPLYGDSTSSQCNDRGVSSDKICSPEGGRWIFETETTQGQRSSPNEKENDGGKNVCGHRGFLYIPSSSALFSSSNHFKFMTFPVPVLYHPPCASPPLRTLSGALWVASMENLLT